MTARDSFDVPVGSVTNGRRPPIKVVHITSGFDETGGAEMMLYRLLAQMNNGDIKSEVIALRGLGSIGKKLLEMGIPVRSLDMRARVPNPALILRLAQWLRESMPDAIQTWTYPENLIGGLAAKISGKTPVVWGIHHTDLDPQTDKRTTIWTASACAKLSNRLPDTIICCTEASKLVHTKLGYPPDKMIVIHNGFDLSLFRPDPDARLSVRNELGLSEETPVIGFVARFHPQKDHKNFIKAAGNFHSQVPESQFILCGDGITWDNHELAGLIDSVGIRDHCHLLGPREDIPRITAAFDVATVSSSHGEAFPLVIGEAMACGVPCVVTDVGDSAEIVDMTGIVVPRRDSRSLANGWGHLLLDLNRAQRSQMGLEARRRIEQRYTLRKTAQRYGSVYQSMGS